MQTTLDDGKFYLGGKVMAAKSRSLFFPPMHMNSTGGGGGVTTNTQFSGRGLGVGVVVGVDVGGGVGGGGGMMQQLAKTSCKNIDVGQPSDPHASRPSTSWALPPFKSPVLGHVLGHVLGFSPSRHLIFLSSMALLT